MTSRKAAVFVLPLLAGLFVAPPASAVDDVEVTIEVLTSDGSPVQYAEVGIVDAAQSTPAGYWVSGEPAVSLAPGSYVFDIGGYQGGETDEDTGDPEEFEQFTLMSTARQVDGDVTLTFAPPTQPMALTVRDDQNSPVTARGTQSCEGTDPGGLYTDVSFTTSVALNEGVAELPVLTDPGADCTLLMTDDDTEAQFQRDYAPATSRAFTLRPRVEVTVILWPETEEEPDRSRVHLSFGGANPLYASVLGDYYGDGPGPATSHTITIERNDGPFTVSTSLQFRGLGETRSLQSRTTRTGTGLTGTEPVIDAAPDVRPVLASVQDPDGQPSEGTILVRCETGGETDSTVIEYQANDVIGSANIYGLDGTEAQPACSLKSLPPGSPAPYPPARARANAPDPDGPNPVVLTYPVGMLVGGTLSAGAGGPVSSHSVRAEVAGNDYEAGTGGDGDTFQLSVSGTPISLVAESRTDQIDRLEVTTAVFDPVATPVRDIAAEVNPVRITFRAPDGSPATGDANLYCDGDPAGPGETRQTLSTQRNGVTGSVTLWGMDGPSSSPSGTDPCQLYVASGDAVSNKFVTVPDGGLDVVVYSSGDVVTDGDEPPGDDGVSDIVEALGPNDGDGNADGVPDHEQDNVTSLPIDGQDASGEPEYVTVEAPAGTELEQVSTQPVGSVGEPPPAGVTLTSGLVSFRLVGLSPGATATVTLHTTGAETPDGYAKYHDNAWTTLPADRVVVDGNAVAIELTDGGIGDDDGTADGTIVDPGGPAIVESTDTEAPEITVSGITDGGSYVVGAVPAAGCTASDASDLDGPCRVSVSGGRANGVGSFTAVATARDVHGNEASETVRYTVRYRVDGFLAPINQPGSEPLSVFRAGSTVRVSLVLRRADGSVIAPVFRPTWAAPVRDGTTRARVNEAVSRATPSQGLTLTRVGSTWTYAWGTQRARRASTYLLSVRLDDGTTRTVRVGLN